VKALRVNIADCGHKKLVAAAVTSGFVLFDGNKHTKVKTSEDIFVAMIPRHEPINKHTARGIVKAMNEHGAKIST